MMNWKARRFLSPDGGDAPPAAASDAPGAAPQATPAAPVQASTAEPAAPKWLSQLPKERQASVDKRYYAHDTIDKLLAHAEDLDDKIGRAIVFPGKDSSPEEKKACLDKMGIPETPDGYGLDPKAIKGGDVLAKIIAETAHKKGFSKDQAKAVFALFGELGAAGEKAQGEAAKASEDGFKTEFLKLYGGDEKKAQTAIRMSQSFMAKRIADPGAIQALHDAGLFKNPAVVAAFAKIEDLFIDPKFVEGRGGGKPAPAGTMGTYSPEWQNRNGGKR